MSDINVADEVVEPLYRLRPLNWRKQGGPGHGNSAWASTPFGCYVVRWVGHRRYDWGYFQGHGDDCDFEFTGTLAEAKAVCWDHWLEQLEPVIERV
jgi:hypothetical protein